MLPKCARVLKADEVEMGGTVYIGPAAGRVSSTGNPVTADGATQQARILESNDTHAILEVICSCGCKSRVQCNYGNT